MIKSYELKIYPNTNKAIEVNKLLTFWRDQLNHFIKVFWNLNNIKGSIPPKEYRIGGRYISDVSKKAWSIVKSAKKVGQTIRPEFKGNEIDLNEFSGNIIEDFETKEFDIWLNVLTVVPRVRLKLPCKKHSIFNEALKIGKLKKSMKIIKRDNDFYVQMYVDIPEKESENKNIIGLDMGLNKTVATSDGRVFGKELKGLRINTKWRTYNNKTSPFKQGSNRVAKQIVKEYPSTDFAVEDLLFKGKKGRSRTFRRRNNNWAYAHLSHKLDTIGNLEGFRVYKVNPAYTSQQCPGCGFTSRANRICSDTFRCGRCGLTDDVDHIGAVNICERVARNLRSDRISR